MPIVDIIADLKVLFYSNEGSSVEPIHFHVVCASGGSAKFWVLSNGTIQLEGEWYCKTPLKKRYLKYFTELVTVVESTWLDRFGSIEYHS